jgi:hypothetical protein
MKRTIAFEQKCFAQTRPKQDDEELKTRCAESVVVLVRPSFRQTLAPPMM